MTDLYTFRPEIEQLLNTNPYGHNNFLYGVIWEDFVMYVMAYSVNPDAEERNSAQQYVQSKIRGLGCVKCRTNALLFLSQWPVDQHLSSRATFWIWLVRLINHANEVTGKPQWDVNQSYLYWSQRMKERLHATKKTNDDDNNQTLAPPQHAAMWVWITMAVMGFLLLSILGLFVFSKWKRMSPTQLLHPYKNAFDRPDQLAYAQSLKDIYLGNTETENSNNNTTSIRKARYVPVIE